MSDVLDVINECSFRGERPLSVIDLIESGTLSEEQAAWLGVRIASGSSFLVGARPNLAGKTTIMCALLAFVPENQPVFTCDKDDDWTRFNPGDCVVTQEISSHLPGDKFPKPPGGEKPKPPPHGKDRPPGPMPYISGEDVRQMCLLPSKGCSIVGNLHCDNLEQVYDQIGVRHEAGQEGVDAFSIFIPITFDPGDENSGRTVETLFFYTKGIWKQWSGECFDSEEGRLIKFISSCRERGIKLLPEFRTEYLEYLGK